MLSRILLVLMPAAIGYATATKIASMDDPGWDLASYVSCPGIRTPLLNITLHDPDASSPGYWFMAPYGSLDPFKLIPEYLPYQVGPLIYDSEGELVWSGSYINGNRQIFDFRPNSFGDLPVLTFVMRDLKDVEGAMQYPEGAGMILNNSYQLQAAVEFSKPGEQLNMHEFNVIDGRASLSVASEPMEANISVLGLPYQTGRIMNDGFREIDIATGNITFEWFAMPDHVSVDESMHMPPAYLGRSEKTWDCFHLNSVDKNHDGDYLISIRHTNTIYKISGRDSSVLWRLGGKYTDFVQDFNFSSQHDAKFHEYNQSVTVISFLDNAGDERKLQPYTSTTSSVKLVALYTDRNPMEAKLLKAFYRPDGDRSYRRGKAQFLPNNGLFVGWSDSGYISEFAPDGHLILEAKFLSSRFDSYRSYKYEFVGNPVEPPMLKVHAYGDINGNGMNGELVADGHAGSMASVFHVSWNGATEVKSWRFYGTNNITVHLAGELANYTLLGSVLKSGFETTFMAPQFWAWSYVEGYDQQGLRLGVSEVEEIILPNTRHGNVSVAGLLETQLTDDKAMETVGKGAQMIPLKASKGALVIAGGGFMLLTLASVVSFNLLLRKRSPSSSSLGGVKYTPVREVVLATEEGEMVVFDIGDEEEKEQKGEYTDKKSEDETDRIGDMAASSASPRKYVRSAVGHARMRSTGGDCELPRCQRAHGRTTSVDFVPV